MPKNLRNSLTVSGREISVMALTLSGEGMNPSLVTKYPRKPSKIAFAQVEPQGELLQPL